MSTFFANKKDYQDKKWQVVDANNQIVGRLAARISRILMGKNRPDYTSHVETGEVSRLNVGGVPLKRETYHAGV